MIRKRANVSFEAVKQVEIQGYTYASPRRQFLAISGQRDQQVSIFHPPQVDKSRHSPRTRHGKDVLETQRFLVKL
jgi:hypothetical protein